ncbi:hypothetical protein NS201_12165 [Pseudomonas oryzihabitans]|nr:hypothetical protein BJP27_02645 [Pseudomonas psychrotolerans]KTT07913.1 hypothetical protein NS2R_21840 [Pseudomonas psychrotolerans]KTT30829.1 hypothetical protein NS201_12165 [Pseudomonas psychrotolerans]KTT46759.1 hypothetical protein SB11R_21060 [Pseudomonas psychrotolerans]
MSFFLSGIGNLQVLLDNCRQREREYFGQPQGQRRCADPFVFARAALIYRKRHDVLAERAICARWELILQDFESQAQAAELTQGDRALGLQLRNRKQVLDRREERPDGTETTAGALEQDRDLG